MFGEYCAKTPNLVAIFYLNKNLCSGAIVFMLLFITKEVTSRRYFHFMVHCVMTLIQTFRIDNKLATSTASTNFGTSKLLS